jgi:PTS system glucose-specific IIC component
VEKQRGETDMSIWKSSFVLLQKIGKAMMLPVSVLPVAGILLGVGSSHITWIPSGVSELMAQSGGAIFGSLPLIFAIAVAVGLTNNDGVAALAATVGFVVQLATLGVVAQILGHETQMLMGVKSVETGVFGGILIGAVAASLFNRYYKVKLPTYLGFFAGKRFVPIVTAFAAIGTGIGLSVVWPPLGASISYFSKMAAYGNPIFASGIYGFVERLLIPFGLHHIWNVPFFFQMGEFVDQSGKVVHGDIQRFFAGDPTAGILGGAYLFKMCGLPAAAIAIWHCAKPSQKAKVGSLMVSAALTSFLTGITEPIEFSFLFIAPGLYLVHAVLAGLSQFLCGVLGVKLGFTFSHGLIDYLLYYSLDTRAWLVLMLGPAYALLYYGVFRGMILGLDLKTPGREVERADSVISVGSRGESQSARQSGDLGRAGELVQAFGGKSNILSLDACITRLRVELRNLDSLNTDQLKQLGASGVLKIGNGVQAVFGPLSENLRQEMEEFLGQAQVESDGAAVFTPQIPTSGLTSSWIASGVGPLKASCGSGQKRGTQGDQSESFWLALGGRSNLLQVESCAATRVRLILKDLTFLDESLLREQGVQGVMFFKNREQNGQREEGHLIHLILGSTAPEVATLLGR